MSKKKTIAKAVLGTAAGATALVGAIIPVAYELILNIPFAAKIGEKFSPAVNDIPEDTPTEAAPVENEGPSETERFGAAVAQWHSRHQAEDVFIVNDKGQKRHAKVFDNGHPEKWAIIFHGYTSNPCGMYHYAYTYGEMGFNCLLPSMIGHGDDPNSHCSMGYHDRYMGVDFINYLCTLYPDCEIVLHGESMGAATTMLITGEKLPTNIKCAVSDCGFTTCFEEYTHVSNNQISPALTFLLPAISKYSELRGNFRFEKCAPIEAVRNSVTPTLFVHGEADDFVPFRMMNEVYTACSAPKEFFTVKHAAHAESSTKAPTLYWTNVYNFVKKYVISW